MDIKQLVKRERIIWHQHFIPGLLAGFMVALISIFFRLSGANIALFASIGSSAVILTHKYRHHLTMLRTVLGSYLIAGLTSIALMHLPLQRALRIFLVVLLATMLLYSFNIFHPPAVSAALAVVLADRNLDQLLVFLIATMAAFIIVRLIMYLLHEHLSLAEFFHEFTRMHHNQQER